MGFLATSIGGVLTTYIEGGVPSYLKFHRGVLTAMLLAILLAVGFLAILTVGMRRFSLLVCTKHVRRMYVHVQKFIFSYP